ASTGWRGDLHVLGGAAHRILSFDQGALKHAFSTSPDDRLGQVLFRSGLIPKEILDQLLDEGERSGARLGELLVSRGLVESRALFQLLQRQAEQIFYGALVVDDGQYAFLLPSEDQTPPPHTLHVPIQGLLMEGVQRIDEMALFRDVIPSNQLCPVRKEGAQPKSKELDPTAKRVLEVVDGRRNILELGIATGLDEFATTKAVYH